MTDACSGLPARPGMYRLKRHGTATQVAPLLLLPGLFIGAALWRRVVDHFVDRNLSVLLIEDSFISMPLESGRLVELASALRTRLDSLGISKIKLVGASFGGLVALEFTRRHPTYVESLVLSGAPGFGSSFHAEITNRGKITRDAAFGIANRIFHEPKNVPDELVEAALGEVLQPTKLLRLIRLLKHLKVYDTGASVEALGVPVDLLWGAQDTITPIDFWKMAAQSKPNWRVTLFPKAGHAPMLESPSEFNDALYKALTHRQLSEFR